MEKIKNPFSHAIIVVLHFRDALLCSKDDVEDTVTEYLKWNSENVACFQTAKVATQMKRNRLYEIVTQLGSNRVNVLMRYLDGEPIRYRRHTSFVKVLYY